MKTALFLVKSKYKDKNYNCLYNVNWKKNFNIFIKSVHLIIETNAVRKKTMIVSEDSFIFIFMFLKMFTVL